ncbi:MAG TPA: D-alanyl-D-alanine carboxypeptidase, partial [Agriterribacter sp.]|nr:D-alanyl-D-alanine carboxypeptidase [Agriterribacter sp.]
GSERWNDTKAAGMLSRIIQSLSQKNLKYHSVIVDSRQWEPNTIPDGWIWQDIGNYYGAGAAKLNWRENQYDLLLQSGNNVGDPVHIARTNPKLFGYSFHSTATSAAAGTGDNAYIYFPLKDSNGIIAGTIPVREKGFGISGAFPSGDKQFVEELKERMRDTGIMAEATSANDLAGQPNLKPDDYSIIHTETSPSLDSIIYWFNKKSINLYGEALLKTMAIEKKGYAATDSGVNVVKDFWKQNGIDPLELNIVDGSGLSPLNRVTTHAQVAVLHYAQNQSWFKAFYNSLPEYNGMKMKSGMIKDVKGFAGYHTAADGTTYVFSFLVNNYNGAPSSLIRKMYAVLNMLK